MRKKAFLVATTFLLIFALQPLSSAAAADTALIAHYDFGGNFQDDKKGSTLTIIDDLEEGPSYGNATSAFDSDTENDPTYWQWTSAGTRGGGFCIDVEDETLLEDYTIGVRFVFDDIPDSYVKIIDYKNRASDDGFYFLDGELVFYPDGSSSEEEKENPQFTAGMIVDLIATRDGETGQFIVYMVEDGKMTEVVNFDDSAEGYAVPVVVDGKVRFGFFHDDGDTMDEATSGGKVYSVKIWDGPITADEVAGAMEPPILTFEPPLDQATVFPGTTFELVPNIQGGEWTYDDTMLYRDGNRFTGLKTGETRITYTVGPQHVSADITLAAEADSGEDTEEEDVPATGDENLPPLWLLALTGGAALAAAIRWRIYPQR